MISVIIPTLNEEKYIESTLKALKNQDYEGKYEIIVADEMSKDKTVEIAKKYADKVVKVKRKGTSVGRNEGAKAARGEILLFIDADTAFLFNGLTEIAKAFKKGVVGVTCPVIPLSAKSRDFAIFWIYNQFAKASLKTNKPQIAGGCCAYRKEAFEKVGGFDEKLKFGEDYDLSERISRLGKLVFIESTFALTSPRRMEAWGGLKVAKEYLTKYVKYLVRINNSKLEEVR